MKRFIDGPHVEYKDFKFEKKILSRIDFENTPFSKMVTNDQETAIGEILVKYSSLIGFARRWVIPQLLAISDGKNGHDYSIGYSIANKMQDIDCFNLAIELCMRVASKKDKNYSPEYAEQFKDLKKMLVKVCEIRNIVAHTDWSEPVSASWYITRFTHNIKTTENDYIMHKMAKSDIEKATEYIDSVNETLVYAVYEYVL